MERKSASAKIEVDLNELVDLYHAAVSCGDGVAATIKMLDYEAIAQHLLQG